MLYFIKNKSQCTGCTACYSSCPKHCITMRRDEEGFLYPVASDACIHCGKCESVCPVKQDTVGLIDIEQRCFAALSRDRILWENSSSGGAFGEICRIWGDSDSIVVGAAWDGFRVHHICISGNDNIRPLQKSKYLQSDMEDVFIKIRDALKEGKKVVFSGVPCQVAGLKNFLGADYNNLLNIDLICHGAGSPAVFEQCIRALEKELGKRIYSYSFRNKESKTEESFLVNGKERKLIFLKNDPYFQLFMSQRCLRKSCGDNCIFRNSKRQGDLTIADFKHPEKVFKDLEASNQNYSTIIINTKKGEKVLGLMKDSMDIRECSIDYIKEYNPLFFRHTETATDRDDFFEDFCNSPEAAVMKWTKPAQVINPLSLKNIFLKAPRPVKIVVLRFLALFGQMHNREYLKEPPFENCNKAVVVVDRE